MFKFLLIIGLVLYVIYKIGTLFFRAGAASQQFRNNQQQANFNQPPHQKQKPKNKAGEYIDYEEVK
ncbi:MAG TPA: hypothetical protein VGD65_23475 [Chryseosolibacter sp.]